MNLVVAASALVIASMLAVAGALKLVTAGPPGTRALGGLELAAAAGVLALWRPAEALAAAMLWAFTGWMTVALGRGRSGARCPCFGGRSRISGRAAVRTGALAALATGIVAAPAPHLSTTTWLGLVVGLLACACAALGTLAFVLAREVAVSRARSGRMGALEIDSEGPALGAESPLIERFAPLDEGILAVAVFVSPGCRLCADLAPALRALAVHPAAEVVVFDEEQETLAWETANVPGSPYAIAMSATGVVLAKGTFNTPEQLESVPATALRRLSEEGLARA